MALSGPAPRHRGSAGMRSHGASPGPGRMLRRGNSQPRFDFPIAINLIHYAKPKVRVFQVHAFNGIVNSGPGRTGIITLED